VARAGAKAIIAVEIGMVPRGVFPIGRHNGVCVRFCVMGGQRLVLVFPKLFNTWQCPLNH